MNLLTEDGVIEYMGSKTCNAMIILFILIFLAGPSAKAKGAEKPVPRPIMTMSCSPPVPPRVMHAFTPTELEKASKSSDISVIISHGVSGNYQNFRGQLLHVEYVPVFASKQRDVAKLTKASLREILAGKISDWRQLGSREGPINLYLHGGDLQRKSFSVFLQRSLELNDLKIKTITYAHDYGALERLSSEDPNALVMGLMKLRPIGLTALEINGISLLNKEVATSYPFQIPVFMYVREESDALNLSNVVIEQIRKRYDQDLIE